MSKTRIRVSLIIPAYNEEQRLSACLDAVAAQTVQPHEVIVVDNNSTDCTAEIASQYPFVRVVREPKRGVAHARNAGFNNATGEVIGRIDTDTLLCPTWIAEVQRVFADPTIAAVSGSITFYDVPFTRFFTTIDGFFRRYLAANLARRHELFLYGSNMALTKAAWQHIGPTTCTAAGLHEDIDLAAHFAHTKHRVVFDALPEMRVVVSARRIDSGIVSFCKYTFANSRTYALHGLRGRYFMYPVELLVLLFYMPLRILYRSYDPQSRRFSVRSIFYTRPARISPIDILGR